MITYFLYLMDELNKPFYCDSIATSITDNEELKRLVAEKLKRVISLNPKACYLTIERYIDDELVPLFRKDLKTGKWKEVERQ